MTVFRVIRLALWGSLLGVALAIALLAFTVSQTTSSTDRIEKIAHEGSLYKTIRSEVIVPQLESAAQSSKFSKIANKELLESAVNDTFSDGDLEKAFQPATTSLARWLDGKEPTITFSITLKKQLETLKTTLVERINNQVLSAPDCDYASTPEDMESGLCKSPYVTKDIVNKELTAALQSNDTLKSGTITEENFPFLVNATTSAKRVPQYVNMLYSAGLFMGGLSLIVTLWLLFKHRFTGIIVIGVGLGIAAGLLTVAATYIDGLKLAIDDASFKKITDAIIGAVSSDVTQLSFTLGSIALIVAAIGIIGIVFKGGTVSTSKRGRIRH